MAYGDSPYDEALLAQWSTFCDRLKDAGKRVFKDANPPTALHRADGFRYLTQNLGVAFQFALETKDTKYPRLLPFNSPTLHLGSDNADCTYIQAWIDGDSVYKLSGKKGTARMLNITVQGPRPAAGHGGAMSGPLHEPFGDTPEANLFGEDLKTNWDGTFELYIGGDKQGQNWIPTTRGARKLFLRQYFDGWKETSAEFRIERVGMMTPRPMPMPEQVMDAMKWASNYVYDVVDYWPEWPWENGVGGDLDDPNSFSDDREMSGAAAAEKRRGRAVGQMWWEVQPDEALIVEFDDPGTFWMITCENPFCSSMDFLYRSVSYTPSRTSVDADGKIRLVLGAQDPGYRNWIDCAGFVAGMLTVRNVRADHLPEISTTLVKLSELARHMHSSSKRTTPRDRAEELRDRFEAINRRYRL